ncbi:MAG TPA: alpha/beta hydrolase domain-containing protein, partial [Steroidobacteraceae bacterium]|nr:alpha/beta hydrolase domain-containing protein [Steroidobacteraceae bacterium]
GRIDAPRVPVLMFLTETEKEGTTAPGGGTEALALGGLTTGLVRLVPALGVLNIPEAAPPGPDGPRFRVWEIAGSSHYDRQALDYMTNAAFGDVIAPLPAPWSATLPLTCGLNSINRLGQERPVRAALRALNRWVATGEAPLSAPRLEQDESGALVRDGDGLAVGGIRMPPMVAPIGLNEGKSCIFFGRFKRFAADDLRARYATAADYRAQVDRAANRAVRRGWLLPEGADAYRQEAKAVDAW